MWIWIAVIVVILVAVLVIANKKGTDLTNLTGDDNTATSGENNGITEDQEGVEDTSAGSEHASSPAATLSYQQALVKYKDARLQLDKTCQGSPDKMTFKNGTSIMVDNRSPLDRVVKVGSTFNLKAYGFKIVKLSSDTLPATLLVDCDKSQNVATILLQS